MTKYWIILFTFIVLVLIYFIWSFMNLKKTRKSLEDTKLHYRVLQKTNDELRMFKHDFSNTLQCIDGYIINEDMNGLKNYYKNVKKECNDLNNLTALNSNLFDDPALYNLIISKYSLASSLGIVFNISISRKLSQIQTTPYILSKILGILLDNAIEAAKTSDEKEINFDIGISTQNSKIAKHIITTQNTYSNKDVDLNKICEKGYTSKTSEKGSHGLGLFEVNKILKKNKNLNLFTTKNEKFFTQKLEIYNIE